MATSKIWIIYNSYDGQMFCGTESNGMYFSADSGETWQNMQAPDNKVTSVAVSPLNDFLYIATPLGLHKSTDSGVSWQQLTFESTPNVYVDQFNNIFAWINTGPGPISIKLHKSTDEGETWIQFDFGSGDLPTSRKFFTTNEGYYFLRYAELAGQYSVISRSSDQGTTWEIVYGPCSGFSSVYLFGVSQSGYVLWGGKGCGGTGVCNGSIKISYDNMSVPSTSINIKEGLPLDPSVPFNAFFNKKGSIYTFVKHYYPEPNKFFKLELIPTSIKSDEFTKLSEYHLSQNYPNPFNPTTTIRYELPERGFVYDVLGNEVASLGNEEKLSGSYEIKWNASDLPSGIYFYRMRARNFVGTKKLILLK